MRRFLLFFAFVLFANQASDSPAAAISIFGLQSGAALATVVGVLVEAPVMLSVVWIVNRTKPWYEASL